jgi:hypothetical protein
MINDPFNHKFSYVPVQNRIKLLALASGHGRYPRPYKTVTTEGEFVSVGGWASRIIATINL